MHGGAAPAQSGKKNIGGVTTRAWPGILLLLRHSSSEELPEVRSKIMPDSAAENRDSDHFTESTLISVLLTAKN